MVAQSYNVFRFLMACQSRGRIQTKFNGGLFTQPLHSSRQPRYRAVEQKDGSWLGHEDDRDWGRRFTFQNQRLLYWPLLMSGDGDLMMPFFDYYWNLLPIRKAITKTWFGHEGAYYRENICMEVPDLIPVQTSITLAPARRPCNECSCKRSAIGSCFCRLGRPTGMSTSSCTCRKRRWSAVRSLTASSSNGASNPPLVATTWKSWAPPGPCTEPAKKSLDLPGPLPSHS